MSTVELRRLTHLEDKDHKLNDLEADLSLNKPILQDALAEQILTPAR